MSEEYLEEACYYLAESGITREKISKNLHLKNEQIDEAIRAHKRKIERGKAKYDDDSKQFWVNSFRESSGDEKITMVDDKGRYYHGWKSELEGLSSEKLVELLVINKQYSDKHPLSEFSKGQAVIGYDPIVPLRNIRRTVTLLEELLAKKEGEESQGTKRFSKSRKKE